MKKSILMFFIFISNLIYAQDFHVNLKATGLTCAMCSYSTQRSLERLDFVESITPDLEETSFLIDFKKDKFKGEKIKYSDLIFLRPQGKLAVDKLNFIKGKILKKNVKSYMPVDLNYFKK